MRHALQLSLVTAALAALASPAAASAMFAAVGPSSTNGIGNCSLSGPPGPVSGPASAHGICSDRNGVSSGTAASNSGHVGARSDAASFGGLSLPAEMESEAMFTDSLMFTSSDPTATFADVRAHVVLHGVMNAAGDPTLSAFAAAGVNGFTELGGEVFSFRYSLTSDGAFSGTNSMSLLSGSLFDGVLQTPTVRVPLNQAVSFGLFVKTSAVSIFETASAFSDFSGSFKFPTGSDAFDLTEGVTVNAGDYLVNNRFIDPLAAQGVPEPTAWALMIGGLGLVGGMFRRRRAEALA